VAEQPLLVTPSQTVGPYFRLGLCWLCRTEPALPEGAGRLTLRGRVLDGDGRPVDDALLEAWQAGLSGRYPVPADGPQLTGFARVATDATGAFSLMTYKPGRVAGPDGRLQAPHLAVNVFMRGLLRHLVTRVYFPDEAEANAADPVLALVEPDRRRTLVARAVVGGGLAWDVVLQGPSETVFFETGGEGP